MINATSTNPMEKEEKKKKEERHTQKKRKGRKGRKGRKEFRFLFSQTNRWKLTARGNPLSGSEKGEGEGERLRAGERGVLRKEREDITQECALELAGNST
jgi:hypothetical protein